MSAAQPQHLEDLAEALTRRLGIPFYAGARAVVFRDRLGITDWAVPLIFDGHARFDGGTVVPVDFAAHALWPALRPRRQGRGPTWWSCNLSPRAAEAILESLAEDEPVALDDGVDDTDLLLDDLLDTWATPKVA